MLIAMNFGLLIVGFILLIKGADYFVDGASGIADKFNIPQIIIGLTIVAFGTSAPEAAISIVAALQGSSGIAVGNILGSNILNVLVILGLTAVIVPLKVQYNTLRFELPFVLIISIVLAVMGAYLQMINFYCGLILWALFLIFFGYLIKTALQGRQIELEQKKITEFLAGKGEEEREQAIENYLSLHTELDREHILAAEAAARETLEDVEPTAQKGVMVLVLMTLAGLAAIVYGSEVTVNSASALAKIFGMSDRLIGLTIVAFGTSLPELMTSVTAARRGNADIAVGNIVGSNIFNILFVLGTASLITNIPYAPSFFFDSVVNIVTMLLLISCVMRTGTLRRKGGLCMLVVYGVYFTCLLLGKSPF